MAGLFRYSGNKVRLLKHYRSPPPGTKRVVEPYLGSGSYMLLGSALPGLGFEANGDVVAMWNFLKSTTPTELRDLAVAVEDEKRKGSQPSVKDMNLPLGPRTYVRVNCTSVVVGQLKSWRIYPQHRLPVEDTIGLLPRLKDVEVVHGDPRRLYVPEDGDLLFIDPPYAGTTGGYEEKGGSNHERGFDTRGVEEIIARRKGPVIFTHGDGASELYPGHPWEVVSRRKVPNVRKGGTIDRTEWVAYVGW